MKSLWLKEIRPYHGPELRSLFGYLEYGVCGDSILAWRGPCEVRIEHMVDGEDQRANAKICGDQMVHFIIEKFDCRLITAVALQRLFASLAKDTLQNLSPSQKAQSLRRDGDDLFFENQKLSISIATVSPVSALIHFAVNVTNKGTPVPTLSLEDLGVEPELFAKNLMSQFVAEMSSLEMATQKVHWVK